MKISSFLYLILFVLTVITGTSCNSKKEGTTIQTDWVSARDSSHISFSIEGGLQGPEAVRFDPDQDIWFISNFNGGGNEEDANGFITKSDSDGNITDLKFITAQGEAPLHAPRGMFIRGDELWVADVNGIHAFNRVTGEQIDFISFEDFEIGFLNDISADEDGTLYVTDTGTSKIYRITGSEPTVYLDSLPSPPNGITFNADTHELVFAPWGGGQTFYASDTAGSFTTFTDMEGGYFDGVEFVDGYMICTSQQDSSVRIFDGSANRILIHTPGRGADIGVDRARKRIAVPYIAENRVDVWNLNE